MYIKEGMKKKIKKKCTKRGKGWKGGKGSGKLRCVPHSMRAKWSAKTETARCATGSSVGRTQGLPATSAEGSSTTPYPVHLFFVDFFQLFETAYGLPSSLFFSILSTIVEEDFTRKSSAWYTNDTIADAIIETLLFLIIWK